MSETITVTGLTEIKSGTSDSGRAWTLRAVDAVSADGTAFDGKLRTFEDLPIGVPIEVDMEERTHPQYGTDYTIKQVGGPSSGSRARPSSPSNSGDLDRRMRALEDRVAQLERAAADAVPF